MKRIRFNKTVFLEGKPVWYKNCWYNVEKEWVDNGRTLYGLISEDLTMRGIDSQWAKLDGLITVEDIPENKEIEIKPQIINTAKEETKIEPEKAETKVENPVQEKLVANKKTNNKKRKSNKK